MLLLNYNDRCGGLNFAEESWLIITVHCLKMEVFVSIGSSFYLGSCFGALVHCGVRFQKRHRYAPAVQQGTPNGNWSSQILIIILLHNVN